MFHDLNRFISVLKKDPLLRQSLLRNTGSLFSAIFRVSLSRSYNKLIIINLTEHIGDLVASEPIAYHLRKSNPHAFIIWSVNKEYADIVNYNPNINTVLKLSCLTEWILLKKVFSPFVKIYDMHINAKRCSTHRISGRNSVNTTLSFSNYLNHGNLLQIGAMAAGIQDLPDYAPRFHFKEPTQPRRIDAQYVVLHTLANDSERNWTNEKWNELVNKILLKYPEVHIAEIGLENIINHNNGRYHDFTGKLGLQEIAHLIKSSVLFIGVESGFAHIANALSKNSIILIGYFNEFKNYMVYSGPFARGENVSLLYYPGQLEQLDINDVEKAIDARLITE